MDIITAPASRISGAEFFERIVGTKARRARNAALIEAREAHSRAMQATYNLPSLEAGMRERAKLEAEYRETVKQIESEEAPQQEAA